MKGSNIRAGIIAAAVSILFCATGATAASLITGSQIKNGTVTRADIAKDTVSLNRLTPGVRRLIATSTTTTPTNGANGVNGTNGTNGKDGVNGTTGPKGDTGPTGATGATGDAVLDGAYWSVAYYNVGDTNAGAIATVACKKQTDTALSGGVSVDDYTKNTPVSSSFPGRMDWSQNKPFAGRLDGWVVQFGGNAGTTSDKSPDKVKVYALCVPGFAPPVEQTFTQDS